MSYFQEVFYCFTSLFTSVVVFVVYSITECKTCQLTGEAAGWLIWEKEKELPPFQGRLDVEKVTVSLLGLTLLIEQLAWL